MRSIRITIGLATGVCALALFATPAHARAPKEKAFFGEFVASVAGQTISPATPAKYKGHGEIEEMTIGPWTIVCEKEFHAKGPITAERSETFTLSFTLAGCYAKQIIGQGFGEKKKLRVTAPFVLEFHANGSAVLGEEAEVHMNEIAFEAKVKGDQCKMIFPAQWLPVKAAAKPEKEYESAGYRDETPEPTEKIKKYPSGFKNRLEISWELKKVEAEVPVKAEENPENNCFYTREDGKYNAEKGVVELSNGYIEGYVEELETVGGELEFSTEKPEA